VRRERGQTAQRPMNIKWEKPRHRETTIYSKGKWKENLIACFSLAITSQKPSLVTLAALQANSGRAQFRLISPNE